MQALPASTRITPAPVTRPAVFLYPEGQFPLITLSLTEQRPAPTCPIWGHYPPQYPVLG